jgi:pilus assembly protein CpaF
MKIDFKQLSPYINEEMVTDINYNGRQLWIDDLRYERYCVNEIDHQQMEQLCYQLANIVNQPFNTTHPIVEAETKDLRISILHESIARNGHSISIRKTPALIRLQYDNLIQSSYATIEAINLLIDCVKQRMNIIVSGMPGAGKTELVKFLTNFINPNHRVITIEDTLELRYFDIHQSKDSLMLKINDRFTYSDAIKASLRQRPDWLLLSEVRGEEIVNLMQAISTGASVMSTVHAGSAALIPNRLLHMFPGSQIDNQVILHQIYESIDIGVHLVAINDSSGTHRHIQAINYYECLDNKVSNLSVYADMKLNIPAILARRLNYESQPTVIGSV